MGDLSALVTKRSTTRQVRDALCTAGMVLGLLCLLSLCITMPREAIDGTRWLLVRLGETTRVTTGAKLLLLATALALLAACQRSGLRALRLLATYCARSRLTVLFCGTISGLLGFCLLLLWLNPHPQVVLAWPPGGHTGLPISTWFQKLLLSAALTFLAYPYWTRFLLWLDLRRYPPPKAAGGHKLPGRAALLPSQARVHDSLYGRLSSVRPTVPGPMVGLCGDWGTGKSFILSRLEEEISLKHPDEWAVVRVNVWSEETNPDLHWAIVRAVLAHPLLLRRCLHGYPSSLVFAGISRRACQLLPEGMRVTVPLAGAALDARVAVPLKWQNEFERVAQTWSEQGIRVLVILDEVDRADPLMAQAAVTLSRRALELPGTSVILSYVDAQLRHKVFNPLQCQSSDLASTMYAVLQDEFGLRLDADLNALSKEQLVEMAKDQAVGGRSALKARLREAADLALAASYLNPPVYSPGTPPAAPGSVTLPGAQSENAPYHVPITQYRLYRLFSDKYLTERDDVLPLTPEDVCAVFGMLPELQAWDLGSMGITEARVGTALAQLKQGGRAGAPPSIRAFKGELLRLLHACGPSASDTERAVLVLSIIVLAYFLAATRQRNR